MDATTELTLALTGDSMITRHAAPRADAATQALFRLIREADVAFANLEMVPNTFRGYPAGGWGGTHMAADARVLDDLVAMGFDLFACATNHSLDYHIEGVLATIEELDRRDLAFAGIGRNLGEARMPAYFGHPKGVVAMLSCCSTFSPGQEAGEQRPEIQGRPGLNPLRFETIYDVTADQMAALRTVAEQTGLEEQRQHMIQLGFRFAADDPEIFPLLGANFRAADRPAVHMAPRQKDVEAIAAWTRDARTRADIVVVSVHGHEQAHTEEEPASFTREFARRMIDEGADLVAGHGPHLLRGMEVYRGKPIFYSLGNFIAQNDLIARIPADSYERFRVDRDRTPSELFRARSDDGRKGFPADSRYWESVVPICRFEDGRLAAVEIVPIELGHRRPVSQRGLPRLAAGDHGAAILARFARLSEPFKTRFTQQGDRAVVDLTSSAD